MATAENVDVLIRQAVEGAADVRNAAQRIRDLGGDADTAQGQADDLTRQLDTLGNQNRLIAQFAQLKRETGETGRELEGAREHAADLGKQYNRTEKPTAKLTREFERARKEVRELDQRQLKQRQTLQQLRGSMQQAGVSTNNLSAAQQKVTAQTQKAQQRMEGLRSTTDKTETELRQSGKAADALRRDFERIGVKPFQDVEKEVRDTEMALDRLRRSGKLSGTELQRATQGANQRIAELRGTTERTAGTMGRLRGAVTGLATGLLGGAGLVAGIRAAVSASANFEKAMSQVQVITRATGEDLQQLEGLAREMGATTQFSATQAANGMQFLARAGFDTKEIISALPATLNLATAEGLELGNAADITSNILSGFNLEAERTGEVADILVRASQSANTNVQQLGEAMATAAPIASSLGFSVGDTAAAIGVLSNAGIQGQRAGTGLRSVLASLSDVTPKAGAALDSLGLTAAQVNPQTNSLAQIIERLRDAGLQSSEAFQIFGREAAPAILALTGQTDALEDLNNKIRESGGAAEDAAEKMRDNLLGDFNALKSAASELAISIGESGLTGALRGLLQAVTGAIRAFTELPGPIQATAAAVAGLAAATATLVATQRLLGPLLGKTAAQSAAATTALGAHTAATRTATTAAVAHGAAVRTAGVATGRLAQLLRLTPWGIALAGLGQVLAAYLEYKRAADSAAEAQERVNKQLREGIDAARENAAAAAEGADGARAAIDAIAGGVDNLTASQRAFYRSNLQQAEQYLEAQIAIGVREQELHGNTRIALGEVGEQLRAVRAAQEQLGAAIQRQADGPYSALQDRVDALRSEFNGLGDDIGDVAAGTLQALGDRARANLGEAQQAVADVRAEFPALQNVSDEALARIDQGFADAIGRVEELNGIINTVSEEALRRLGIDASEVMTGVRSEVRETIGAFDTLASDATTDARLIEAAYGRVLEQLDSPAELRAFESSLQQAARAGFDVGDALEVVRNRLRSAGDEATVQGDEVARVTDEYGRLGDAAEDAGSRAENAHRRAADAARDQARATEQARNANSGSTYGGATTIAGRGGEGGEHTSPIDQDLQSIESSILNATQSSGLSAEDRQALVTQANARLDELQDLARSGQYRYQGGVERYARAQADIIEDVRRQADEILGIGGNRSQRDLARIFRPPSLQERDERGTQSGAGGRDVVDININTDGRTIELQGSREAQRELQSLLEGLANARAVSAAGA